MKKGILWGGLGLIVASCSEAPEGPELKAAFRDCEDCPLMQPIPSGSFQMGSTETELWLFFDTSGGEIRNEYPRHKVSIDYKLSVGVYEVSIANYRVFSESTDREIVSHCAPHRDDFSGSIGEGNWEDAGYDQSEAHPVTCITWQDAVEYTQWLSKMTGHRYRLPSESEWEYAARGGADSRFFWGLKKSDACRYSNISDRYSKEKFNWGQVASQNFGCTDGFATIAETNRSNVSPNQFGLYDVIGNVDEFVSDCYNPAPDYAPTDGSPVTTGDCKYRVIKGNSWGATPIGARPAFRSLHNLDSSDALTGFRVVRQM